MNNILIVFMFTNVILITILAICEVPLHKSVLYMAVAIAVQAVYLLTIF